MTEALTVRPGDVDAVADIDAVLGLGRRGADSCWCRRFLSPSELDNRTAFHDELARSRRPLGVVASLDGRAAGWSRVAPRRDLPGIVGNRALQRILDDDPDAWWITCFVVRPEARGRGVGLALLEAAIGFARDEGANALEGHPVDVALLTGAPAPSALFTGVLPTFRALGFAEIGRTYPSRPVMRLDLVGTLGRPTGAA